jgi:hypothetical protein
MAKNSEYWFQEDAETVAEELIAIHSGWMKWSSNPVIQSWTRNLVAYYSAVLEPDAWDTSLTFEGEQGELVKMLIPEARSLTRQYVSLITKQRLAFQAIAETTGHDVTSDIRIGNSLGNQVVETQRLDTKAERLAEMAYVVGGGFLKTVWRSDKGIPRVASKEGALLYDGDVEISVMKPWEVYYDYTIEEWDNVDWAECRTMKSRWSLIAQFPGLKDEILALPSARSESGNNTTSGFHDVGSDDLVFCYEAYHRPTPAIPQGRMLMYSDAKTIYFDGANRYETIPIEPMTPEQIIGMGFGYAPFSNMLPAQEMLDHSYSAVATNQSAFAVQNVTVARGAAISVQSINGMNFISFTPQNVPGGGKPEALQLTQSSPETFKFAEMIQDRMVALSNLNAAIRGQPPAGVTSGAAIATLTSNALEFTASFSKSWVICIEKTMQHAINAYQKFCEVPHLVYMVGKDNQTYAKKFVGGDLKSIRRMKMSITNPLLLTIAGRTDIADKMLKTGLIKTPQQYFSLLEGASPQTIYKDELSESDLLEAENDELIDGKDVIALSTDDHAAHIRSHAALLNNPSVRRDNERVETILDHILEHDRLAKETDPFLLAMVRTGKMPEGGPPQPEPQGPQMPPGGGEMGGQPGDPASKPAQPANDMLSRGSDQ